MIAYKLCRELKNGDITSLFINKTERVIFDIWIEAKSYPTKNFALRPFWHCTSQPIAPHLSKKGRVWVKVEIKEFEEFNRPINQGGVWYLAKQIKFIKKLKNIKE